MNGSRIIRTHRQQSDALLVVILIQLFYAAFVKVRRGTVIAIEDNCKDVGVGVFAECVPLPVNARQGKIRRWRTKGQDGMCGVRFDFARVRAAAS